MKSLHENSVGIWAWRHEEYLRQHRHITYMTLLPSGELDTYLAQIEKQAAEMMELLIVQFAEQEIACLILKNFSKLVTFTASVEIYIV